MRKALNFLMLAAIGAGLLYFSLRGIKISEIKAVLITGNYTVVFPVFVVSLVVYLARVKRWQILFQKLEESPAASYLFASLATGYMVNFVVPRLGEITRAIIIKRWLGISINRSLSTVFFERITDIACLAILVVAAFFSESISNQGLLNHFTQGKSIINAYWLLLLPLIAILWYLYKRYLSGKDFFSTWIREFVGHSASLLQIEKKGWYLFHTMVIWVGFYLMTYLWFFMFKESSVLSPYQAFLVMTLGVIARSLPIQAGSAGAYHFVVSQALYFMGLNLVIGNALAIVIHGFQTILTLFFGGAAYLWLLTKDKYVAEEK